MMSRCVHLLWLAVAITISGIGGCASQSAEQEEQSKAQAEVLSGHFKERQPESRK